MRENGKPGFMIYHRQISAMRHLEAESFKKMIMAFAEYSISGEVPGGLDGAELSLFEMYCERLDHDAERYEQRVYAAALGGKRKAELARKKKAEACKKQTEADSAEVCQSLPKSAEACRSLPKSAEACRNLPTTSTTTPTSTPTTTPTATATSSSSSPEHDLSDPSPEIIVSSPEKEEEAFPPTREMVVSYLHGKGWNDVDADDFLRRCRDAGWKDGNGRPVKSWRMWLNGYVMKQSAEAVRNRCAPDPRIGAFERLKQRYIREEAQANE